MKRIFTFNNIHNLINYILTFWFVHTGVLYALVYPLKYDFFISIYNNEIASEVMSAVQGITPTAIDTPSWAWYLLSFVIGYILARPYLDKIKIENK